MRLSGCAMRMTRLDMRSVMGKQSHVAHHWSCQDAPTLTARLTGGWWYLVSEPTQSSSATEQMCFDSRLANVARIYDVLLGGKDNYAADQGAARRLVEAVPDAQRAARDNRAFLGRAVHFLAAEAGIEQSVEGDVRYPRHLLTLPAVRELIDFSRPVAVLLVAVVHFIPDSDSPWSAVRCITDHLAPGSYLVISHVTGDQIPDDAVRQAREIYAGALVRGTARSRGDIARFFDGADLIEPGLVDVATWRSRRRRSEPGRPVLFYAGVGCKQRGVL